MSAAKALSSDKDLHVGAEPRASEPSMEDILASIRRIIADDQSRHASANGSAAALRRPSPPAAAPGQGTVGAAPPPARKPAYPVEPAPRPAAPQRLAGDLADGIAMAAGPLPHLNPPATPVAFEFDRSVIDEIASAGVAAALKPVGPVPQPDVAAPKMVATAVLVADRAEPVAESRPVRPLVQDVPTRGEAQTIDLEPVRTSKAPSPAPGVGQPLPSTDAAPTSEAGVPEEEPLVSPAAGASIESSFNALAGTMLLQNAGMVENAVRDMLRPMLKTWLDSNLPAIVERLIRVEIERVARGGRA